MFLGIEPIKQNSFLFLAGLMRNPAYLHVQAGDTEPEIAVSRSRSSANGATSLCSGVSAMVAVSRLVRFRSFSFFQQLLHEMKGRRGRVSGLSGVLALMALGVALPLVAQTQAHFSSLESSIPTSFLNSGVAIDRDGAVYVLGNADGNVLMYTPMAGGGYTPSPLNPVVSGLKNPTQLTVSATGVLYIADTGNNQVVSAVPTTTNAAKTVVADSSENFGLSVPQGVVTDALGNVYIADTGNNRVVEESPVFGTYTQTVLFDSSTAVGGYVAYPVGLAFDPAGDLLVADDTNGRVLLLQNSGGSLQSPTLLVGGLSSPESVAADASGDVYISDITAGSVYKLPLANGSYGALRTVRSGLSYPFQIALDASGSLYIANFENSQLYKETFGAVNFGSVHLAGVAAPATLNFVFDASVTLSAASTQGDAVLTQGVAGLDFADAQSAGTCAAGAAYSTGSSCQLNVTFAPTRPGARYGAAELLDGSGNVLATANLSGVGSGPQVAYLPGVQDVLTYTNNSGYFVTPAVDSQGNVYLPDFYDSTVLLVTPAGGYATLVTGVNSGISNPESVAVDGAGNLYIGNYSSRGLVKATLTNGSYTTSVIATGFSAVSGLAVDGAGSVYVVDNPNGNLFKETPGTGGTYTQTLIAGSLTQPTGVAVDASGNVFITESAGNQDLLEYTPAAGGGYTSTQIAASLSNPAGVAIDAAGDLYVGTTELNTIFEFTLANGIYTQSVFGTGLQQPNAVAFDGAGNLYITDAGHDRILKQDYSVVPALNFPNTNTGATSASQVVTLENLGNQPLVSTSGNPMVPASFNFDASSTCAAAIANGSLAAGTSCTLSISFAPLTAGPITGALTLTDNNLGISGATQSIALSGTGTTPPDTTSVSVTLSASPIVHGQSETLTATVSDATSPASPPTGSVTFTDANGATLNTTVVNGSATVTYTPNAQSGVITATFTPADATAFAASSATAPLIVQPFGPMVGLTFNSPYYWFSNDTIYVGQTDYMYVIAVDAEGNTVTTYNGPLTVTTTDSAATLSVPSSFSEGAAFVRATFETPGTQTFTAVSGTYSATSGAITVSQDPTFMVTVNTDTTNGVAANCTDQTLAGAAPDANCSLRDAVAAVAYSNENSDAEIGRVVFTTGLASPIVLANGDIEFDDDTIVTGPGAGLLAISGNQASLIFDIEAYVQMSGLTLTQGSNNYGYGGAIYVDDYLVLHNMTLSNNTTSGDGGAVFVDDGSEMDVYASTFTGNTSGNDGGAIAVEDESDLELTGSTFTGNVAAGTGGAIALDSYDGDTAEIVNSTFTGNTATLSGGGIATTGSFYDDDARKARNKPSHKARITTKTVRPREPEQVLLTLTGATIAGNAAGTTGGGIDSPNSGASLANSIVAGNASTGQYADFHGIYLDNLGNLASNNQGTASLLNPGLAALGNYGGPTQTMIPLPGSAAICSGVAANAATPTDQRGTGYARSTGYGDAVCVDAGAVESNYSLAFVTEPVDTMAGVILSPAPSLELNESGVAFTGTSVSLPLTLIGAGTVSGATANTTAGLATYSSLAVSTVGSGDTLGASLTLNPASATPVVITAVSTPFNVLTNPSGLTFAVANHTYGDAPFSVAATSSSAGAFTYSVTSGPATITGSAVTITGAGTVVLAASQAASGNFAATEVHASFTVAQAGSATALTSSASAITTGATLTLTAAVTAAGPATGTVTFLDGTTVLGSATLASGTASYTTTALTAGSHSLSASYGGDANVLASVSSADVVTDTDPTFTLGAGTGSGSSQTITAGGSATYSFALTPVGGLYPGTVSFAVSGLPVGATYTITPSTLAANAGAQTITLTIQTAASTAMNRTPVQGGLTALALAALLLPLMGAKRLRKTGLLVLLLVACIAGTMGLAGCSSGGPKVSTSPETTAYTVVLKATAGGTSQTYNVTLNVTQ